MKSLLNRSQLITAVRLILSVVMLVILFSIVDRRHFVDQLMQVNLTFFAIGLACYFGYITLWAVRWHYILRGSGEKIGYRRVLTTTLIGNFFAMFLPEMVGNDLARMSEVSEERKTNARIVSTVLLDRVIGLISLVLMAMLGLVLGFHHLKEDAPVITLLVVGLFVGLFVGWLLFFNRGLMRRLNWLFRLPLADRFEAPVHALYNALHDLQTQPRLLLVSVGMSFALQLVEIVSVIFIALALGINVPFTYFFVFMPIIWVITMVPISISGLGVREGAFAFFFSQVGMASENAIALSLLYYSYLLCTGLVGGLLFLQGSARVYLQKRLRTRAQAAASGLPFGRMGGSLEVASGQPKADIIPE